MVQTAVEIPHIGAPYNPHFHLDQSGRGRASLLLLPSPSPSPSPISQTHLGRLAIVFPLWWYKAHARAHNAHAHAQAQIHAENNDDMEKNLGDNGILEANENDNTDCKKLNQKLTQCVHVVGGAPNCVLIGALVGALWHTHWLRIFF